MRIYASRLHGVATGDGLSPYVRSRDRHRQTTSRNLHILPRKGEITDLETESRPFARFRVTDVVWAVGLAGTDVRVMVAEEDWEGSA